MKSKLLLMLLTTAALVALLFGLNDYRAWNPFVWSKDYINVSRVHMDEAGSFYTIADSKTVIRKVSSSGELIYAYTTANLALADTVQLFDGITVDDQGYAYALVTDLDAYGLRVLGQRIIRIADDGRDAVIMFKRDYDVSDQLFRSGRLQSPSVVDNQLYFLSKESNAAELFSLPLTARSGEIPTLEQRVPISGERYLNELTGRDPQQMLYTTKRGLLHMYDGLVERRLYPNTEAPQLHFPVNIVGDGEDAVYFIDHHEQAVMKLRISDTALTSWLPLEALQKFDRQTEWEEFTSLAISGQQLIVVAADQLLLLDEDGKISAAHAGYDFPWDTIIKRFLYWGLALGLAIMIVLLVRFCYIHVLKRKVYLLLKQLAVFLPLVLLSMFALFYQVYQSFSSEMKEDTFHQLKLLASNGKYLVGQEHLEKLNSPRDYGSEDYMEIKLRLNDIFSQTGDTRDGLYNTIYRYIDGQLYVIMDDDSSQTMYQPFALSEDNLRVLNNGETVAGTWTDAEGEWMFALGPLYNSAGEIIGIYETGKDLSFVYSNNKSIFADVLTIFVLVGFLLLLVITLMTIYLLSSIRKLRRNVNLIASGEWDVKVDIRTRDEVEELGQRFNMMASSISQYLKEVTKLSNSYFRFVPEQFLKVLGKTNMTQISLGEQQNRKMAILVCNMRGFDAFSAQLTTEETFAFINSFLKRFGPIVREHGGFISRYLGAGMLTMFPGDTASAIQAALQLSKTLGTYNSHRLRMGYEPIEINISVHYGDVMLGIIGEEQRIESSVVSSHVALALELEKTAEKLGANILLTQEALRSVNQIRFGAMRKLGGMQIGGRKDQVELYDLYEADGEPVRKLKQETELMFEEAIAYFRQGKFHDARERFVEVVRRNRYDLAAKLYFFESDRLYQEGASNDWNHAMKVV